MSRLFKKISAIILTAIMVLTMCSTVFAEDDGSSSTPTVKVKTASGTSNDKGIITVQGIKKENGIAVTAYKIVKADYDNNNGNFTGYSEVYGETIADISDKDNNGEIDITAGELNVLAQKVKKGTVDGISYPMSSTDADDTDNVTYTAEVPVGSYLVLVSGAESVSYNVAVVSVYYSDQQGKTIITEGTVDYLAEGNTWIKRNNEPGVDKKIVSTDSEGKETESTNNSANIGDTVNYKVTINPVPDYRGTYPVLKVIDTLSKGLTYSGDLIVTGTKNGEASKTTLIKDTDYTISDSKNDTTGITTITVDFVVGGVYKLNDYAGTAVVISYSAKVNENAELNEKANINTAKLQYTKDSNTESSEGNIPEKEKKTYTYTFDIKGSTEGNQSWTDKLLIKTGEDEWTEEEKETEVTDKKPLNDAEFTLYTDESCETIYTNKEVDGTTTVFNGVTKSGDSGKGQFNIYGLEKGTYYLKETKAPEGYTLNSHVFKIGIDYTANDDGILKDWTIKIDDKTTNTFTVDAGTVKVNGTTNKINSTEIKNTKTKELPSTGGMGTYIFTIVGVVLMVCAAGAFMVSRKKSED